MPPMTTMTLLRGVAGRNRHRKARDANSSSRITARGGGGGSSSSGVARLSFIGLIVWISWIQWSRYARELPRRDRPVVEDKHLIAPAEEQSNSNITTDSTTTAKRQKTDNLSNNNTVVPPPMTTTTASRELNAIVRNFTLGCDGAIRESDDYEKAVSDHLKKVENDLEKQQLKQSLREEDYNIVISRIQQAFSGKQLTKPCSGEQLEIVKHQLPPGACEETRRVPWYNRCSYSYATRCPDSTWLEEFYGKPEYMNAMQTRLPNKPVAVYIGCNKAMDAVNALRMISSDDKFDKELWRDTFSRSQVMQPGHCGQEHAPHFELGQAAPKPEAVVHCIEAMPITARQLNASVHKLKWENRLRVLNAAMSSADGSAMFPDQSEKIGVEQKGMGDCKQTGPVQPHCKQVPMYKFDTFVEQYVGNGRIDFVSIDVEGFDREVLVGASDTLDRIGYIEFEYNWRGMWPRAKLSETIQMLREHGFACYWAGAFGNIWRISECWHEYYDIHQWSNVACVNTFDPVAAPIHRRMEEMFHKTLSFGSELQYANETSSHTNGRGGKESSVARS